MITSTFAGRLGLVVSVGALGLLGSAGTSFGSAPACGTGPPDSTATHACAYKFDSTFTQTDVVESFPCLAPGPGVITITGENKGGFVVGAPLDGGNHAFFKFHSNHTESYRADFPDGTYVLGQFTEHFHYTSSTNQPTFTLSSTFRERGTVYGPDDRPTGQIVTVHGVDHFTWIDTQPPGTPGAGDPSDGDVFKSSVENVRLTCR